MVYTESPYGIKKSQRYYDLENPNLPYAVNDLISKFSEFEERKWLLHYFLKWEKDLAPHELFYKPQFYDGRLNKELFIAIHVQVNNEFGNDSNSIKMLLKIADIFIQQALLNISLFESDSTMRPVARREYFMLEFGKFIELLSIITTKTLFQYDENRSQFSFYSERKTIQKMKSFYLNSWWEIYNEDKSLVLLPPEWQVTLIFQQSSS